MGENELPEAGGAGGIVPHFYYDILGRIVPGVYLLVACHWLIQLGGKAPSLGNSLSLTAIVTTAVAAYLTSFVIGPVSYLLFDWLIRFDKNDVNEIKDILDKNGIAHPVGGQKKDIHDSFVTQSELCGYTLWLRAPQLAIICSRWDAEAFTARQIGTITIILFGITAWMTFSGNRPDHAWIALVLGVFVTVSSAQHFRYSRRKAILARFRMLAQASQETMRAASAK
jgi:hypothetical protein